VRFIHTADTHLGFEILKAGRGDVQGRRRWADSIKANFSTVVRHALETGADLFIHSGDLFNKHYIHRETMEELVGPIVELGRMGVPVLIIPGNHERSEFPFDLFHGARNVFVFDRPRSLLLRLGGYAVGFAGFPFIRNDSRRTFPRALEETEYAALRSDFNILVTHQAFDQATVGPGSFTFQAGRPDTVSRHTLPLDFDYVAAGHVHLHQVLSHPLKPQMRIVYPGAIQRMSFAEMHEEKGFVAGEAVEGRIGITFVPLPACSMETVEVRAAGLTASECERAISSQGWRFCEELVIRFNLTGGEKASDYPDVDFDALRARMPKVLQCQFAIRLGKGWVFR
jgi:exonuclease SbcD